ncbi:MAG TPA: hypothetical protein GXZ30_07585 [Propionibacterium sp.]|nr:hypothetical protein [Propionibacterium sp.]
MTPEGPRADHRRNHTDSDATTALEAADRARRDAVAASMRPAWVDAVGALMVGGAAALTYTRSVPGIAAAAGLLIAFVVLGHRFTRRRGRLTDDRAVKARLPMFLGAYAVVFIAGQLVLGSETPWWWLALAGIAIAAVGFAFLRFDERYQARRLAAGDHGPYDLT